MKDIDVVIPWVDGNDPLHKKKREHYMQGSSSELQSAVDDVRFVQSNEIYYCINSVIKFMPWVRNIYLVTDGQTPSFLKDDTERFSKIIVVDHKEIFAGHEEGLPTFNSRTIASGFWRIPALSNDFIVLCDDFFIIDYVAYECFFKNEKKVVYGQLSNFKWYRNIIFFRRLLSKYRLLRYGILTSDRVDVSQRTARALGFKDNFLFLNHSPMVFSKKSFEYFFSEVADFAEQIKYRFRSSYQYLPEAINSHYLLKNNEAVLEESEDHLFELYASDFEEGNAVLDKVFESGKYFLCAQSVEMYPESAQTELFERLDKLLGLQ